MRSLVKARSFSRAGWMSRNMGTCCKHSTSWSKEAGAEHPLCCDRDAHSASTAEEAKDGVERLPASAKPARSGGYTMSISNSRVQGPDSERLAQGWREMISDGRRPVKRNYKTCNNLDL